MRRRRKPSSPARSSNGQGASPSRLPRQGEAGSSPPSTPPPVADPLVSTAPHHATPYPTTRPFVEEPDSPFLFLYRPHTASVLAVAMAYTAWNAYQGIHSPVDVGPEAIRQGWKRGLKCIAVVFLAYCVVQLRDTVMVRPHPIVWRLVQGVAILYLLGLVFLLVQEESSAREFISFLFPDISEPPADNDRLYATDCRLYTPGHPDGSFANVQAAALDLFVYAHFLGSFGKTLILRDWRLTWVLLVIWEVLEYSFQHILFNFAECWWDHWLLDVFGFNLLGVLVGTAVCRYFAMRSYDWTGFGKGKLTWRRVAAQLLPYNWTSYQWDLFSSFRRWFAVAVSLLLFEVVELNAFFLKYVLHVPPDHKLNAYRLLLWFFLGVPAFREYYMYATNPRCKRFGPNLWLSLATLVTEVCVILKFGSGLPHFSHPWPWPVVAGWATFFTCVVVWTAVRFRMVPLPHAASSLLTALRKVLVVVGVASLLAVVITQDVGWGSEGRAAAGGW